MSPKSSNGENLNSAMKPKSFPLCNPQKSAITRRISSYLKLVYLWNAKENLRRKIAANCFGWRKPTPTCALLSSSNVPETQSEKVPQPPMVTGLLKTVLNGTIGKLDSLITCLEKNENKD